MRTGVQAYCGIGLFVFFRGDKGGFWEIFV